jgi:ATP/maltotriose-dependent transcriptional regulator MalT
MELRRAAPAEVAPLHRASAEWHGQQGVVIEAIPHAQAGRDWRLASRLLPDNQIDLTFDGRAGSVAQLLSAFPDDAAGATPSSRSFSPQRACWMVRSRGAPYFSISPGGWPMR